MDSKFRWIFTPLFLAFLAPSAWSHCEIPCGIFDDKAEIELMREDAKTIEKGMNKIVELSKDPGANANQLTRWINNKDEHAHKIKESVAFYFFSQRVKAPKEDSKKKREAYHKKLVLLHDITVAAMKAKQTTDLKWVEKLTTSIDAFEKAYFKGHSHH